MPNDISLTVRIPHDLSNQLQAAAKKLGMTRTNLLRGAIHDFLTTDSVALDFSSTPGDKDRLVLNVNQMTHTILLKACERYNQSMNAVVVAVSALALERAATWLQSTKL